MLFRAACRLLSHHRHVRYFVQGRNGGPEKGPFTLHELHDSAVRGLVRESALVREESGEKWMRLHQVFALANHAAGIPEPRRDEAVVPPKDEGSFWWGFLIGAVTGVIGLIITLTSDRPSKTRIGAATGFFVQVVVGFGVRAYLLRGRG